MAVTRVWRELLQSRSLPGLPSLPPKAQCRPLTCVTPSCGPQECHCPKPGTCLALCPIMYITTCRSCHSGMGTRCVTVGRPGPCAVPSQGFSPACGLSSGFCSTLHRGPVPVPFQCSPCEEHCTCRPHFQVTLSSLSFPLQGPHADDSIQVHCAATPCDCPQLMPSPGPRRELVVGSLVNPRRHPCCGWEPHLGQQGCDVVVFSSCNKRSGTRLSVLPAGPQACPVPIPAPPSLCRACPGRSLVPRQCCTSTGLRHSRDKDRCMRRVTRTGGGQSRAHGTWHLWCFPPVLSLGTRLWR